MTEEESPERLQKIMARFGIASRRVSEEMIEAGRVKIGERVAVLGNRVSSTDVVLIDEVPLLRDSSLVHYLLNKPVGVISTSKDPSGRPTVVSLVPQIERVFPVGRLDSESEGLLIITNDGDLTHRLTHPSFGVPKEYLAHVVGVPAPGALRALREGVELDDGLTSPAQVSMVQEGLLKIVIHEGRNRQVRRMCESIGHPVLRLVRTRIGPISDPKLESGKWRLLSPKEVRSLYSATLQEQSDSTK